jgi:NTE family protein
MEYKFKNLVFEGGGVKGIAYGGALDVLDNMKVLPQIERVAGTSAGAITATLLALGFTSGEVADIIAKTNFKEFEDNSLFGGLFQFTSKYGWFKGDKFKSWIGDHIKKKTGNSDYTFRQLHSDLPDKSKNYKELYVIGTNLTLQAALVFSFETTPDLPIKEAVRASMSIPLYFQSVTREKHIWVDGGVSWNYPVNIFDHVRFVSNPTNAIKVEYNTDEGFVFNFETLGFRLDSTQVIEYNGDSWKNEPVVISNIKDYALGLVNFMMEMANKKHLHNNDWNRTVFIDTLDVKTTDFKLPDNKIKALIQSGRDGVIKYFAWRNTDPEWSSKPV